MEVSGKTIAQDQRYEKAGPAQNQFLRLLAK
jgi:hypothetical protein